MIPNTVDRVRGGTRLFQGYTETRASLLGSMCLFLTFPDRDLCGEAQLIGFLEIESELSGGIYEGG